MRLPLTNEACAGIIRSIGVALLSVVAVRTTEWSTGETTQQLLGVPAAVVAAAVMAGVNVLMEWVRHGELSAAVGERAAKGAGIAAAGVVLLWLKQRMAGEDIGRASALNVTLAPWIVYLVQKVLTDRDKILSTTTDPPSNPDAGPTTPSPDSQ